MELDNNDHVWITFKKMIEAKGFVIDHVDEDELIYLSKGDYEMRVSLDNLRKDYEQTPEDVIIEEFVEAISSTEEEMPDWPAVRPGIYPSLCPSDFEFGEYINYPITEEFNMVIVYDSGNKKVWINENHVEQWEIDNQTLLQTAYRNLDAVLDNAILEVEEVEGKKLGYFSLEDETMKSVLVLSKQLRRKVEPHLGWPVVTVIPVRDFSYLFAETDFDFFAPRLADITMDEYKNSGYPITTELLVVDDAVRAIAKYEVNEE